MPGLGGMMPSDPGVDQFLEYLPEVLEEVLPFRAKWPWMEHGPWEVREPLVLWRLMSLLG